MFVGSYEYKVDNKGRLPLPPKFRKDIDDGLMLTLGADNCIAAYTKANWEKLTENQAPTTFLVSETQRKLTRYIYGNANDVTIDNQGRIALPASLRERCNIADVAVVVGFGNSFEIWNPTDLKNQQISADDASQLVNKLEDSK